MNIHNDLEVLHPDKGVAVVECRGEHDLTTRQEIADLLEVLLEDNELVVVDVSEAQFIDSTFINNLFIADGFARQQGKRFRLQVAKAPLVAAVLDTSGVLSKLDCAGNREQALR